MRPLMPDLVLMNAKLIDIEWRKQLTDPEMSALARAVQKTSPSWPKEQINLLGLEDVGTRQQGVHFQLIAPSDSKEDLVLSLESWVSTTPPSKDIEPRLREAVTKVRSYLDMTKELGSGMAHATMDGSYLPDTWDTIVSLPLLTLNGPEAPFDQIVGVRLAKRKDKGWLLVTLTRHHTGRLDTSIHIPLWGRPGGADLISDSLQRLKGVSAEFITVRQQGG